MKKDKTNIVIITLEDRRKALEASKVRINDHSCVTYIFFQDRLQENHLRYRPVRLLTGHFRM